MAGKLVHLAEEMNPTFKVLVPSLNRLVKFRSFLVREQKLLLVAKEAKENKIDAITGAITQLIQNCVKEELDVTTLPAFDLEYVFVQLYMSSTAKKNSTVHYRCKHKHEDGTSCDEINRVSIDLKSAHIPGGDIKTGFIDINSDTIEKIKVRYPTFEEMVAYDSAVKEGRTDDAFELYGKCLINVFKKSGELMVLGEDYEADDAIELLEYFHGSAFEQVVDFFVNSPTLTGQTEMVCKKCGTKATIDLKGLEDFF